LTKTISFIVLAADKDETMAPTLHRQRSTHPAGSGLGRLAPVTPLHSAPSVAHENRSSAVRLDADALERLATLYGSSCVTPWSERDEGRLSERVYELLESSEDFEVWVIHWPTDGLLRLHDHGGSSGALWVVSGALEEGIVSDGRTYERRRIEAGRGTSFGPQYVHDVANIGAEVATSVHVYSPPMEKMTFFALGAAGLTPDRTEYRADPAWAP
jgi:mannose-6-phosphate isomerase-like protein (cupin superfamily)